MGGTVGEQWLRVGWKKTLETSLKCFWCPQYLVSVVGKFGRKSKAHDHRSGTCICKRIDLPENSSWLSGEFPGLNPET